MHASLTSRGGLLPTPEHKEDVPVEVVHCHSIIDDDSRTWRSCCLKTDRQATVYIGQLVFSFSILGFSAIMLVMADGDCNKSSPYIGLISFLMGKLLSTITTS